MGGIRGNVVRYTGSALMALDLQYEIKVCISMEQEKQHVYFIRVQLELVSEMSRKIGIIVVDVIIGIEAL